MAFAIMYAGTGGGKLLVSLQELVPSSLNSSKSITNTLGNAM